MFWGQLPQRPSAMRVSGSSDSLKCPAPLLHPNGKPPSPPETIQCHPRFHSFLKCILPFTLSTLTCSTDYHCWCMYINRGKKCCIFLQKLIIFKIFIIIFLVLPHSLWDLSSLTRNQTHAPCIRSMESYPLDHQGSFPEVNSYLFPGIYSSKP